MLCMGLCAWRRWGFVLPAVWRDTAIYGFQFRVYTNVVLSGNQNAAQSQNIKIVNS